MAYDLSLEFSSKTGVTNVILYFRGARRFLSNFSPAFVSYGGRRYEHLENAYYAWKTTSEAFRERLMYMTPARAKRFGKTKKFQKTHRADYSDATRVEVMEELVRQKFKRNVELTKLLLETGNATLVEGTTWDDFFGVDFREGKGYGLNHLGRILMKIRQEIRDGDLQWRVLH